MRIPLTTAFLFIAQLMYSQFQIQLGTQLDDDLEFGYYAETSSYFGNFKVAYAEAGAINENFYFASGFGYQIGDIYSITPSIKGAYFDGFDLKGGVELKSTRYEIGFILGVYRLFYSSLNLYSFGLAYRFE